MNDLAKRKQDLDAEFAEVMEMEDDAVNTRSTMTIAAVAKLLNILNENVTDMAAIANNTQYYDPNLTASLQSTVSQLVSAFSQIKSPVINVNPSVKFDALPLQPILSKISEQNERIIDLQTKYNSNQSEELYMLISGMVNKNNSFIEKVFQVANYSNELKSISEGVNKKSTEWIATVGERDKNNFIQTITFKAAK